MQSLHADLRSRRGPARFIAIALGVALFAACTLVIHAVSLRAEIGTLTAHLAATRAPATGIAHEDINAPARRAALRAISDELMVPWEPLLDAITENAGAGIALRSIRPDAGSGRVEISGAARSRQDFLAYLERLRKDKRLRGAEPLGDEPDTAPGSSGILFRATALWGAAP
ncbi:MAG: hypothetical protein ACOY3X_13705 [Pseudomonadota bacterium]